jgi:demethylmenaquinone methyltransferase/2-methoxy-6-polyprenyl-1,4-benzoquinol methylase
VSGIRPDRPATIKAMFETLAPHYDRLNTLLTFGLDRSWRRAMVRAAGVKPGERVLDVCAGTGRSLDAVRSMVGPDGLAVGVDFTEAMLRRARGPRVLGDALRLPFAAGSFDASVSAFAVRDVADQRRLLEEMARVTAPGGGVALLEVGGPRNRAARLGFELWFRRAVPRVADAFGQGEAHRFLVRSVEYLPEPEALLGMMENAGLEGAGCRDLSLGAARVFWARTNRGGGVPPGPPPAGYG